MKGQLTGESSVLAYLNAIELGCRCVEIDLWVYEIIELSFSFNTLMLLER